MNSNQFTDQELNQILDEHPDISYQEYSTAVDLQLDARAVTISRHYALYVSNISGEPILVVDADGKVYHRGKLVVDDPELSRIFKKAMPTL